MTEGRILPLLAVLLAACPGLTGCHGDTDQAPAVRVAPQPRAPVAVKPGPTPEELTAGMVEAVTVGRSTVPVTVKFDLPQRPVVGQPLEVVLAVIPQTTAGSASLQVIGGDGLQLAPGMGPVEIPSIDPTQVYRARVMLTPTADGLQLLGLNISLKHDDTNEARSFSVPLIVATSAEAAAAASANPATATTVKH
ncbi:MAG: hypothetical protein M3O41_16255 [Pseudomonadota bacterium]|nr:hypothetical protein [Pseudomonadota bacterium]